MLTWSVADLLRRHTKCVARENDKHPRKVVRNSCSIRFDRGFEIFSFLQSNAGLQLLDPLLQCNSILPQYGDRLHIPALIASILKIVDVLPELLR